MTACKQQLLQCESKKSSIIKCVKIFESSAYAPLSSIHKMVYYIKLILLCYCLLLLLFNTIYNYPGSVMCVNACERE